MSETGSMRGAEEADILTRLDRDHEQFKVRGESSLFGDAAQEIRRLRQWKREATELFDGLQDLGRALDLPLGVLVTGPIAVEAAERLRAKSDTIVRQIEAWVRHGEAVPADVTTYDREIVHAELRGLLAEHRNPPAQSTPTTPTHPSDTDESETR